MQSNGLCALFQWTFADEKLGISRERCLSERMGQASGNEIRTGPTQSLFGTDRLGQCNRSRVTSLVPRISGRSWVNDV